jgi:N-acetylneuraminic acid mutarotase
MSNQKLIYSVNVEFQKKIFVVGGEKRRKITFYKTCRAAEEEH